MTDIPNNPPTTTRRDRRIIRQRQDIMDAAARLFAVNGYAATTTKDIAAAVDIGESTLYGYFPGKQEILVAICDEGTRKIDSMLAALSGIDDYQAYVRFVDQLMETLLSKLDYTRALIGEAWINDRVLNDYVVNRAQILTHYLEEFITLRINKGTVRQVEPLLIARIMIATFIGALLPVLRGVQAPPNPDQRKSLAEAIVQIISDGISVHSGRQTLP